MTLKNHGHAPLTGGPIFLKMGWTHDPEKLVKNWTHGPEN